jgi:uncharacterized membrane protein YphA (DoxX/SURF4 family)
VAVASVTFRFVLASVFFLAGASKLPRRDEFEHAVRSYGVLPDSLPGPVATWLPRLEVVCALLLAAGLGLRPVAVALAALLVVFSFAVAVNLLRGRELDCGCFGFITPRRITWLTVVRNLVLAGMAVVAAIGAEGALALDAPIFGRDGGLSVSESLAVMIAATLALAGLALLADLDRFRRAGRAYTGRPA